MQQYRLEHDFLGDMQVPTDRYYGIQTQRGVDNFPISGVPIYHFPEFIKAFAFIKKACAEANHDLCLIDPELCKAIVAACDEIANGRFLKEFVVDMIQGGGGTSTNMNFNEVIANRALELLGYEKGRYDVLHPNNHVNLSQSTNDVYPTAISLALNLQLDKLAMSIDKLGRVFSEKGREFADVVKIGRTELQDAVPMTLGQEFTAYSIQIMENLHRLTEAQNLICKMNLGATAIGTGINAHPDYAQLVAEKLRRISGVNMQTAPNLIEATQDTGAYVQLSGVLKRFAVKISKICNDLRLLASGPRAGLNEISLPAVQPGSSIMPGKINPVIPDVVNEVAFQVIGADVTITMASEAGQLELNAMEPIIAYNLFFSIEILQKACNVFADRCVSGITANRKRCRQLAEQSIGLATALNPILGYETAARLAKRAYDEGKTIAEVTLEEKLLSKEQIEDVLRPENMMKPQYTHECKKA